MGARFAAPVTDVAQARALPLPDPERDLGYVLATVRAASNELAGRVPLIGFAGGPWTLAAYMLEGRSGGGEFRTARAAVYAAPEVVDVVVARLVPATVAYLAAQARAGADALMLFESWAGLLTPEGFARHCLAPLQGNLDPAALYAPEAELRAAVRAVIADYGAGPGHIFNLGHGIAPDVDPKRVAALIDEVHRSPPDYLRWLDERSFAARFVSRGRSAPHPGFLSLGVQRKEPKKCAPESALILRCASLGPALPDAAVPAAADGGGQPVRLPFGRKPEALRCSGAPCGDIRSS